MIFQVLFNGLVTGAIISLPALAITLLFGVLKFPNFAVGSIVTMAAYVVFALNVQLSWPLALATVAAAVACGLFLVLVDSVIFRPMRDSGSITLMVASLGVGLILENMTRFFYGNAARSFQVDLSMPFRVGNLRMNTEQLAAIAIAAATMLAMYVLLMRMPMGRKMRAIADNPSLAVVRGIDRPQVIRWMWMINGALLAIAGALIGMDRALEPMMGSNYLIAIFAAAILGGLGSPLGAFVGALIVGLSSELSTLVLPTGYRTGVPLCLIAAILIWRPQGLFGRPHIKR